MSTTIRLKNSGELNGANAGAKEPTAGQLVPGELAMNYNSADPALFLKDSAGNVIRIAGQGAEGTGSEIITQAITPNPDDYEAGTLWWNSDTESMALFVLYDDPSPDEGKKWIEASPTPGPVPGYPGDLDDGKGATLDTRYVMVTGSDMSGDLTLGGDKIELDATDGSITAAAGNVQVESIGADNAAKLITLSDRDRKHRQLLKKETSTLRRC